MAVDIKVDLSALGDLSRMADKVEPALESGLDVVAIHVQNTKRQTMQKKTYDRPERIGKNGQREWERTGDWMQGQTIEKGHLQRTVTTQGNATAYEERLSSLPDGPDGINRTNPAAQRAVEITANQVQPVFESELKNKLGL